jgi:outer membrane biosynthesis protein TonB
MPSAAQEQQTPTETQTGTAEQAPPLPQPKPAPPKEHQSTFQLPKPSGAQTPHHEETPHEASHNARYAGPAASKDEYLAYLVSLTRQHMGLLPMSIVGDRHGETVISVVVYDNGRIGPLGVIRSSGYPDIDKRIEDMVAAVGKFPPLPQWYQGDAVQLELTLKFPEALEHQ